MKVDQHLVMYYIGILIIIASHIWMLVKMPNMRPHAVLNIVACGFIAYYFMNKEGYIKV